MARESTRNRGDGEVAQQTQDAPPSKLTVVDGYLTGIDFRHRDARAHDLPYRKALVFDTLAFHFHDVYFDAQLFVELCQRILATVDHDSLRIKIGYKKYLDSFADFCEGLFAVTDPAEREPFREMQIFKGGETVCLIKTEYYIGLANPKPYDDSFTFSVYFRDETIGAALDQAINDGCQRLGTSAPSRVKGNGEPGGSLIKQLINWAFS